MKIHLRGALSSADSGGLGPWLASWEPMPGVRRTMVARRSVPDGWPEAAGLVSVWGPLPTVDGHLWLLPLVEGASIDELLEADEQAPVPILRRVSSDLDRAARGLQDDLRAAIDGSALRLRLDGELVVLPPAPGAAPRGDALARLREAASAQGPVASREEVAGWVARFAEPLATRGDPWTGRVLEVKIPAVAPSKAVVARFGAFTLALGLAAGWVMSPGAAGPDEPFLPLVVPGAEAVEVICDGASASVRGERVPVWRDPSRCRVRATVGGEVVLGAVDTRTGRMYECEVNGGALQCSALSPLGGER